MFRLVAFALTVLAFAPPVAAQDPQALAAAYVATPVVQDLLAQATAPETFATAVSAGLPPGVALTAPQRQALGALASETLGELRPQMEAALVEASARRFTAPELQALIAFYGSDTGASAARKMPGFFQDAMAALRPAMEQALSQAAPRIAEIVREKP